MIGWKRKMQREKEEVLVATLMVNVTPVYLFYLWKYTKVYKVSQISEVHNFFERH